MKGPKPKYDYASVDWSKPLKQTSEETGIPYAALRDYAVRNGIGFAKSTDAKVAKIRELAEAGLTIQQIADAIGAKYHAVRALMKSRKISVTRATWSLPSAKCNQITDDEFLTMRNIDIAEKHEISTRLVSYSRKKRGILRSK